METVWELARGSSGFPHGVFCPASQQCSWSIAPGIYVRNPDAEKWLLTTGSAKGFVQRVPAGGREVLGWSGWNFLGVFPQRFARVWKGDSSNILRIVTLGTL